MACISDVPPGNFIRGMVVEGAYTLAEFQAQGIPSLCQTNTPLQEPIIIETAWNDAAAQMGELDIGFIVPPGTPDNFFIFTLPSGTQVSSISRSVPDRLTLVVAADSGEFDGTVKEIIIQSPDWSIVTGVAGNGSSSWNAKALRGLIDLTKFPDFTNQITFVGVPNASSSENKLSSFIGPPGDLVNLFLQENILTDVDLSPFTLITGNITMQENTIENVTLAPSIDGALLINLDNNAMSSANGNKFLDALDQNVTNGVARTLTMLGTNSVIDNSSGGINGLTKLTSLRAKNYTVEARVQTTFVAIFNANGDARFELFVDDYILQDFNIGDTVSITGSIGYDGSHQVIGIDNANNRVDLDVAFGSSVPLGQMINEHA